MLATVRLAGQHRVRPRPPYSHHRSVAPSSDLPSRLPATWQSGGKIYRLRPSTDIGTGASDLGIWTEATSPCRVQRMGKAFFRDTSRRSVLAGTERALLVQVHARLRDDGVLKHCACSPERWKRPFRTRVHSTNRMRASWQQAHRQRLKPVCVRNFAS